MRREHKDWGALDMLDDSKLDDLEYRIEQLESMVTTLIYVVCAVGACAILSAIF